MQTKEKLFKRMEIDHDLLDSFMLNSTIKKLHRHIEIYLDEQDCPLITKYKQLKIKDKQQIVTTSS